VYTPSAAVRDCPITTRENDPASAATNNAEPSLLTEDIHFLRKERERG
jgi:hypothetical protein